MTLDAIRSQLSHDVLTCLEEAGVDPEEDLIMLQMGRHTPETLLALCLDGADPDRVAAWHEYVSTLKTFLGSV